MTAHLTIFTAEQPRLQALAYRLLGAISEAEDVLQESFLAWQKVDLTRLQRPAAYLTRLVTHRALDVLRSARVRRESYTGPWLPEPWVEGPDPAGLLERDESLTTAFLLLLERLSPLERAVFVLRVGFDYDYDEIAGIVGETAAYCRQLLHRAREHLHSARRRNVVAPERQAALLTAFLQACQQGEISALQGLLAQDATLYTDGGGKVRAALLPIFGAAKVARFFIGVMGKTPADLTVELAQVNGGPGLVASWEARPQMTMAFDCSEREITAIYVVSNPDKLAHLLRRA